MLGNPMPHLLLQTTAIHINIDESQKHNKYSKMT